MDFRQYLGLVNTALTQNPLAKGLLGIGDAAASVGSGILAQPIAGLAGILATPGGSEKAANAVRTVQNRLTYQPRTDTARNALTALGAIAEPLNRLKEFTGDVGYAVGGPVGGMLGATLPDAAMMAAPLAMAPKTPMPFPLPKQGQAGAIVYHGSPHKFDRFDSSKIGTGEGAQAFGHGLYVAEAPNVAKSYMTAGQTVVPQQVKYGGKNADQWYEHYYNAVSRNPSDEMAKAGAYFWEKIASRRHPQEAINMALDEGADWPELAKFAQSMDIKKFKGIPPTNLYKVDLPDEAIGKMLDWDKPLSQQAPEVRAAITDFVKSPAGLAAAQEYHGYKPGMTLLDLPAWGKDPNGQTIYKVMFGSGQPAANALKSAGIPGIRYLDGGSRGAGQGTYNYVVFPGNENLLKILERQ